MDLIWVYLTTWMSPRLRRPVASCGDLEVVASSIKLVQNCTCLPTKWVYLKEFFVTVGQKHRKFPLGRPETCKCQFIHIYVAIAIKTWLNLTLHPTKMTACGCDCIRYRKPCPPMAAACCCPGGGGFGGTFFSVAF